MKRYQNISTVVTAVLKLGFGGEFKTHTLRPGMIIQLSDDDVQATKDSFNPTENNPFDRGFVALIPQGKQSHPDVQKLSKNPNLRQAQDIIRSADDEKIKKMIAGIRDPRGITIIHKALDSERAVISDSVYSDVMRYLNHQEGVVDQITRENALNFKLTI